MKLTDEEKARLIAQVEDGKVTVMRTPPWTCTDCGTETITLFEWIKEVDGSFIWKATCTTCKEPIFS
jgi:hypothetical protein